MVVCSTTPPETRYWASCPVDLNLSHISSTSTEDLLQTKLTDAQKLKIIMEEITRVANDLRSKYKFDIPEEKVKLDTLLWDSDGMKGYLTDSIGITDLLLSLDKRLPGFDFYKNLPPRATPQSILDITNSQIRIGTLGKGHGRSVFLSLMEGDDIGPGVMVTSEKGHRVIENSGRQLVCDLSYWNGDAPLSELSSVDKKELKSLDSNRILLKTSWGEQLKEFVKRFRDLDLSVYYRPMNDLIAIRGTGIDLDPVYFAGKSLLVRALKALGVDVGSETTVIRMLGSRRRRPEEVAA